MGIIEFVLDTHCKVTNFSSQKKNFNRNLHYLTNKNCCANDRIYVCNKRIFYFTLSGNKLRGYRYISIKIFLSWNYFYYYNFE